MILQVLDNKRKLHHIIMHDENINCGSNLCKWLTTKTELNTIDICIVEIQNVAYLFCTHRHVCNITQAYRKIMRFIHMRHTRNSEKCQV